jgi:creatinase
MAVALDRPRTLRLTNGAGVKPMFTAEEMERRLARLRAVMTELDVDAVVFTSYQNINYYADFLYYSFNRRYALVVTHDRQTIVTPLIDFGQPGRRAYAENVIYTDWERDNYFRAIREVTPQGARRIGIETDHVTVEIHAKLAEYLAGAELVDVSQACMRQRTVKSPEEIVVTKQGSRIADLGAAAAVDALHENVPEWEVAQAATNVMVREIAEAYPHSEIRDTFSWFQSGITTDNAHHPVTTRRVQKGDVCNINCFPMIQGYYTAIERTLFLDHCDDASLRYWQINVAVHERGLELMKPGARCSDIANELNELCASYGVLEHRTFGYGHSFGILSHYYGREGGLELREDCDTVLEPGNIVSMEPMITIPEGQPGAGGYREHDVLVITEDGHENITKFPYGPEHNIIRK